MHVYKEGCWYPRRVKGDDPDYGYYRGEIGVMNISFLPHLLGDVEIEVSLFSVNREARRIALAWVQDQSLKMKCFPENTQPLYVLRPFDSSQDILYIPLSKWDDFVDEPEERPRKPDMANEAYTYTVPDFERIAVPRAVFDNKNLRLKDLRWCYFNVKTMYVVTNTHIQLQPEESESEVQQGRNILHNVGPAVTWVDQSKIFSLGHDNEENGDRALQKLIEDALVDVGGSRGNVTLPHAWSYLDIQPVFVGGGRSSST